MCRGHIRYGHGVADLPCYRVHSVKGEPVMFYSTDLLHEIVNVVVPRSLEGDEGRRTLVARLHAYRSSLEHSEVVDDLVLLFSQIERLFKPSLVGLGAWHGVITGGDHEVLRDALMSQMTGGECTLPGEWNTT